MSDETPAPTPETPPAAPETVSRGTAGDPSAPTLGAAKPNWIADAQRKLSEKLSAQPTGATPEAPPAAEPAAPAEPDASASIYDALAAGGAPPQPEAQPREPAVDASNPNEMAALARIVELEQAMRSEQRRLDEQQQALAAREAEIAQFMAAKQAMEQHGGSKLAALKALGWSYEDLTAEAIKGGPAPDLMPLTQRLAELEKQLEEVPKSIRAEYEERMQAAQQQAEEAQIAAWNQQQLAKLKGDPERWGLLTDPAVLQGRDPVELVYKAMEAEWKAAGQPSDFPLTVEQAADKLEASLERRFREGALQQTKLGKILGLTSALTAPPTTPASTAAGRSPDAPAGTTLTPDLASRAPASPPDDRPMTPEDWRRRATEAAAQALSERS